MKRTIISAFALAALVSGAALRPAVDDLQAALALTPAQISALDEVHADLRNEVRPILMDLRTAQRELRDARGSSAADTTSIQMLEARIANSQGWMATLRTRAVSQARSVLTPRQTATVDALAIATLRSPLAVQAVRYNLLESSQVSVATSRRARANQGDFSSDGRRR